MEGTKQIESIGTHEVVLRDFFRTLPESENKPHRISREVVNRLVEQGVTVEELCDEFVKQGFLLHGTGLSGLETLEPRQANDEGGYEENLQNAVYATNDSRIPVFMALRWGMSGRSHYSIFSSKHDNGFYTQDAHFSATFEIPVDKAGSVYVLPKEAFKVAGSDSQFTSDSSVVPLFEIPVTRQDFQYPIKLAKE